MTPHDSSTRPPLVIYAIQLVDHFAFANVYELAAKSREHMNFHGATKVAKEIEGLLEKVGVMGVSSDGVNIKAPDVYKARVENQDDNIDQGNKGD